MKSGYGCKAGSTGLKRFPSRTTPSAESVPSDSQPKADTERPSLAKEARRERGVALPAKFLRNFPGMSRRLPSRSRREERIVLADVRGKIFKGAHSNPMHWTFNPLTHTLRLVLHAWKTHSATYATLGDTRLQHPMRLVQSTAMLTLNIS